MRDRRPARLRPGRTQAYCRRGTMTVLVLVCLLIVVSLTGTMLQSALRARRQLQTERNFRQTELLLRSGLERAAYRLAAEQDYRGEMWEPASQGSAGQGRIAIQATPSTDSGPWQVNVVAEFPTGSPRSIRRSHTFEYTPSHPRVED